MSEFEESYLTEPDDGLEARTCPECRGQCYDRYDNPCDACFGEGVLDIMPRAWKDGIKSKEGTMRTISVDTTSVIKEQPGGAVARGTDDMTDELVTFNVTLDEAAEIKRGTAALVDVDDQDIIEVEPTHGEWDSPGTSPE